MNDTDTLNRPHLWAAIGAWLLALLFVDTWIVLLFLLPSRAQISMRTLEAVYADPDKFLPFINEHPLLWRLLEPDIIACIAVFWATFGLGGYLREKSRNLTRLATATGTIASGFFLAAAMIEWIALPSLGRLYRQNPEVARSAYHAVQGLLLAAGWGGLFATGWWALFSSLGGLRSRQLARLLCYLGIAFGLGNILLFVAPPFQFFGPTVGLVWSLWLGIDLMKRRRA